MTKSDDDRENTIERWEKTYRSAHLRSYGVALFSTVLVLSISLWLFPWIQSTPTALFFMAVMISAWYGGLCPGLVATILSTLAINYYFIPPYYSLNIAEPGSFIYLSVFLAAALLISGLNEARRAALHQEHQLRNDSETAQRTAQAAKEHLETVLSSIDDGFFVLDRNWLYTYVNDRNCKMIGMQQSDVLGKTIWNLFPDVVGTEVDVQFRRAMTEQTPAQFEYFYPAWNRWFEYRIYPSKDTLTVLVADISDRKQTELLLVEQKQLLELIASGQPLDECLSTICHSIAKLHRGTRTCFLLTDAERKTFPRSITPDLPPTFGEGLKDAPINDLCIGTCGEAVYRGQPITCADIAKDDRWSQGWRNVCIAHGILACHSKPVIGIDHLPLGSLMLCFNEARLPTEWEYQLAEFGTQVASIAFERDRLNQQLIQRVDELQTLFDVLPIGVAIADDPEGRLIRMNPYLSELLRIPVGADASQSMPLGEHLPYRLCRDGKDISVEELPMQYAAHHNTEVRDEVVDIVHPDGTVINLLCYSSPLRDEQNRVRGAIGGFANITQRIQNEADLRKSEERFRISQEISLDAFTILTSVRNETGAIVDFIWTYVNPRAAEILQHPVEELVGQRLLKVLPGSQLKSELFERYVRVVETGEPHDIELSYNSDGITGWFRNMAVKLEDGIAISFSDITNRKQIEQALRDAEERLRVALQNAPITVFSQDGELRYTWLHNPVLYSLDEMLGKHDRDYLPPEDAERLTAIKEQVIHTGIGTRQEIKISKDGTSYYYDLTIEPVRDTNNTLAGITCASIDVSELKRTEIALRQSEERFRLAMEGAQMGTWDLDLVSGKAIWSDLHFTMLGYEPTSTGEATEAMWRNRIHPDDRARVIQEWQQSRQEHRLYRIEYRVVRANDQHISWVAALGRYTYNQNGEARRSIGVLFDITDRKQAEVTLQQRESELRLVTNAVPALISFVDSEQRYRFNNRKYEEWFGRSAIDMYGKHLCEVLGEAAYDAIRPYIEQVLAGQEVTYESQVPYKEGGSRYIRATYVPRFNAQGTIDGFVALISDITDRKRAELALHQSEERYRYLVEATPQLVWTADAQGHNDYVNQQMCDYIGLPSHQLLNLDWQLVIHPDDLERVSDRWMESVQNGIPYEAEYRLRRADGVYRWQLVRATPFKDEQGRVIQWIGVSTDIHAKQELEEERARLLQQEQAAREDAERANQIKDEFLAVLSHELRSPLNPILGWAKLLQSRKLDEAQTKQALITIERNAKLQAELIEDLLDVSRILRGKLSLTINPVNLVSTIEAAIETVRLAADAKSIQIESILEPDVGLVSGDSTRLQQVVWNLLSNAVKFTPAGGHVEVRLEKGRGDTPEPHSMTDRPSPIAHYAHILVKDTGQGISSNFLPYVFDYFRQEDGATTRKFGGLGLGLAIVRHLVELHGGTIQAESQGENLGATFTITLPIMSPQPAVNPNLQPLPSSLDLNGVKILVVDDEIDTREFVAFLLKHIGAKVATAASADEALAVLPQFKPDVLLSDIGMPSCDGYTLIRTIRALSPEQGGCIPAIALTAYAAEYDQQQALDAGFQQHIPKPVDPEILIKSISQLIFSSVQ